LNPVKIIKAVAMLFVSIAFICSICFDAKADEVNSEQFAGIIKYDKYHRNYEVNPDGTYTMTMDIICTVLTEEGIKAVGQSSLIYSTSLDKAEILSAYTLKKDGRRIKVPPPNLQERDAVTGGGPMFSDLKAKTIIFPDLSVGDKIAYSYKRVCKKPLFPGNFSLKQVFYKYAACDDTVISVSVPINSLDLHVFARGVRGGRVEDRGGRMQWVWSFENHEITKPEIGAVDLLDYGPLIIVSSFKDYGAISSAYEKEARPKGRPTEKIRRLANELTAGAGTDLEEAKIICTWVAKNVRYAGNSMGIGSIVPHDAEQVLGNKLGDCKDHVVLLQALLASAGIDSTAVLVHSGGSFKLPVIASPEVINHVIIYIPRLDLYFDPSSEYTPFGLLPITLCDKPVVHTSNFRGIQRTPRASYQDQSSTMRMVLHINDDGSADGEVTNEETGLISAVIRQYMASIQPNMEDTLVRKVLEQAGFTGTGTLTKADPRVPSEKYTYSFKFHGTGGFNIPGPGAIRVSPVWPSGGSVLSNFSGINLPERTLDYICTGDISTEEFKIYFPKSVKITSLPKDTHLANGRSRYDSTYQQEGRVITVVRKFESGIQGPVCTPGDDRENRAMGLDVLKDLKAQIIYQPAGKAR